jgi:hypothetical protein
MDFKPSALPWRLKAEVDGTHIWWGNIPPLPQHLGLSSIGLVAKL